MNKIRKRKKKTEMDKLRRQNKEFRDSLFKSSQKVVNLKASVLPAIKLINKYRWELADCEKAIALHKSRETNLLKKIKELTTIW